MHCFVAATNFEWYDAMFLGGRDVHKVYVAAAATTAIINKLLVDDCLVG